MGSEQQWHAEKDNTYTSRGWPVGGEIKSTVLVKWAKGVELEPVHFKNEYESSFLLPVIPSSMDTLLLPPLRFSVYWGIYCAYVSPKETDPSSVALLQVSFFFPKRLFSFFLIWFKGRKTEAVAMDADLKAIQGKQCLWFWAPKKLDLIFQISCAIPLTAEVWAGIVGSGRDAASFLSSVKLCSQLKMSALNWFTGTW